MFEKEAREHAFEGWEKSQDPRMIATPIINIDKYLSFQQGAQFGYDKANEWYYPSKGEYPENEDDVLCYINSETFEVGYFHQYKKQFFTIDGKGICIKAWKSIVPPKEIDK